MDSRTIIALTAHFASFVIYYIPSQNEIQSQLYYYITYIPFPLDYIEILSPRLRVMNDMRDITTIPFIGACLNNEVSSADATPLILLAMVNICIKVRMLM